jgi:hypothetical protein
MFNIITRARWLVRLICSGTIAVICLGTSAPVNTLDVNGALDIGANVGTTALPNGLLVSGLVGIGSSSPQTTLAVGGSLVLGEGFAPTMATLNGALSVGATTIVVNSTANYPSRGSLNVLGDVEMMNYTGKTATTFTGVTRGAYGTTTEAASSGTAVIGFLMRVDPPINDGSALSVTNNHNVMLGQPQGPTVGVVGNHIYNSLCLGPNCNVALNSLVVGNAAQTSGNNSFSVVGGVAIGSNSQNFGSDGTNAFAEMCAGPFHKATGVEIGTSWSGVDPVLSVGISTSVATAANALMVFQNGKMLVDAGTTVAVPAGNASLTPMGTSTVTGAAALNATNSAGASRLYVRNDGNVGIGNTAPASLLHVGSASASGIVAEFQNSSGTCTMSPGTSSMTTTCSSDIRLKTDISDTEDALTGIKDMRIRDFTVRATGERRTGVIAQELMLTHPEMVRANSDGFYAVDDPIPWKLVKALQELKAKKETLLAAVESREVAHDNEVAEIKELRDRLDSLEAARR